MDEPIRVLYVEDDPTLGSTIASFLEAHDDEFIIQTESTAADGLRQLETRVFDCIVSDYSMPKMDGIEFLERVRRDAPTIPFILFTGRGNETVARDAIRAGVTDYVTIGSTESYELLAERIKRAVSEYKQSQFREKIRQEPLELLDRFSDPLFALNEQYEFTYVNDTAVDQLGKERASLLDETIWDHFPELTETTVEQEYREAIEAGRPRTIEEWFAPLDRWFRQHLYPGTEGLTVLSRDITAEKEQERELEHRRELLHHTEALTAIGGWELKQDTEAVYWTDGTYRIHDLDTDACSELSFEQALSYYHPEDRAKIESAIDNCLEHGEHYDLELRLRTAEERLRWVRTRGEPIREDGTIVGARGAIQDITDRKEREQARERAEEFFAEAERLGNLGAWELTEDDTVIWSDGTCRIHDVPEGYEPSIEEAIEFFHPEDRERIQSAVERAFAEGESYDVEARIITDNGNERWIRTRGGPRHNRTILRGYIQDITGIKTRQEELEKARSQLEAAVNAGNVGTWDWDIEGNKVQVDRVFARTFALDEETAAEGLALEEFTASIHEEDRDRVREKIERAVETCGEYEAEYRVWNAYGNLRWVIARGEVTCDEEGNPESFPGVLIDVTQQKEIEEQVNVLNRVLRHNLRNELTVIRGYVSTVTDASDDHDRELGTALNAIDRLIDLSEKVRELIWYTSAVMNPREHVLEELIEPIVTRVNREFPGCSVTVTIPDGLTVEAYPSLELALGEVIENGVKHGGADPVVEIHAARSTEGVELIVTDNGPGMPEQERTLFTRGSETPLRHGSGLGLWIVNFVIGEHGGAVDIDVDADGTSVSILLPTSIDESARPGFSGVRSPVETPNERYRTVFEKSFDAIVLTDTEGRITDANPAAASVFDAQRRDLLGRNITTYFDAAAWEDLLDTHGDSQRLTLSKTDGHVRKVIATFVDDVVLDRHIIVIRDLTEQEQLESLWRERAKELTAIRTATEAFDTYDKPTTEMLADFVATLPPAFQYSDRTVARISVDDQRVTTGEFDEEAPRLTEERTLENGSEITLEVCCSLPDDTVSNDPFLPEEVHLMRALAAVARTHLERIIKKDELETTTQRYERILANSSDYVMIVDEMLQISYISPSVERVMGYSADELIGENPLEYVYEDDLTTAGEALADLLRNGGEVSVEYRAPHRDGSIRWLEVRGANFCDLPTIGGVLVNVRDITERKKRALEVQELRERFQGYVEHASDIITEVDERGRIQYESPAIERILGYKQGELVGESVFEYVHHDDRDRLWEEFHRVIESPRDITERVEYRFKHADESWVWLESIGSNQLETSIKGYVINSRDITERKAQRRELERSKTVIETVLHHHPDGIMVEDADREILLVNEQLIDIFGIEGTPEDLIGTDFRDAAAAIESVVADPATFRDTIEHRIADREPVIGEELLLADGRILERDYLPYSVAASHANLWIYRDETDRKREERERDRQNARLDEFASIVSHDLRNPLTVAKGRLDLAAEECESEHISHVARALDRMEVLIADLLTLARKGNQISEQESVALAALVQDCWHNVETEQATLQTPTDRAILADRSRLQQLLENLLRNAIDHAGPTVTVTVGNLSDGFFLEDDGPGIPEENRTTVFDAGFTTKSSGTGFGLSIVKQIAEAHGWEVTIGEAHNGGARFEITGVTETREDPKS